MEFEISYSYLAKNGKQYFRNNSDIFLSNEAKAK